MNVVLYVRVSTTRQADNDLSIPDQLRQLQEWCKTNGHLIVHQYVEPGASATDDKRPVFQMLINDAMQKSQAFEAIIIHSLSRFFRDAIQFGVYERKLGKNKVKVISITQQTTDDASGEMMRHIFTTFDEYQSKENSKHTSRAMCENARQGFFNGSRPPFGYFAAITETSGSRGRKKKKLETNLAEADIVKMAYDLYLSGHQGKVMGCKEIAMHLNHRGLLMRGKPWTMQKLHTLLSDTLYMGDYYFNIIDSKTRQKRPPVEWVKTSIPAIISVFEQARARRTSRSPEQTPPRRVNSPTLLTGLLKCGICGGHMTVATGKGGRYRYYKCTSRCRMGNQACSSGNLAMESTDQQVLKQLAEQVFTPARLQTMMSALRKRLSTSKSAQQERINQLSRQLIQTEERQQRLLDAIETGIVDLDEVTQRRAQQLKSSREALLVELAEERRTQPVAIEHIKASQIDRLSKLLKDKLLSSDSALAKSYLNLLVAEIVVENKTANVRGSHAALAAAADMNKTNSDQLKQVPTFIHDWRPRHESNV